MAAGHIATNTLNSSRIREVSQGDHQLKIKLSYVVRFCV